VYGKDKAEKILTAFAKKPPLTIFINTLKISRDELFTKLCKKGYPAKLTEHSKHGISIESASITELFEKFGGLFFVQDEASMLCVEALDPQEGETVIDACASPGSKSFSAAISMNNKGEIYSFDLHNNKLSQINDTATKLGINIIQTKARDGREFDESSGYGIMAKKPEIRYKDPSDTVPLHKTQYEILCTNAKYLKKNGVLVYSTCTLLPEENEKNVLRFLSQNKGFEPLEFSFGSLKSQGGMLTLFPDEHNTDGFFIARLIRKQ
jgi:16S rRNA (cytosine967-C5)-methyltransferase